jgi:isoquinoline 1-oxidoreductase subunit alpha
MMLTLKVNGKSHKVDVDPSTPLLWALRDHLNLTGTKYGCGVASCGACTVHINGKAVRACATPASEAVGKNITTIEGLSPTGTHALQKAWVALDVPQCGYCQSGQIMSAAALLKEKPKPTREEIIAAMDGNICRCGTYNKIISAIELASKGA